MKLLAGAFTGGGIVHRFAKNIANLIFHRPFHHSVSKLTLKDGPEFVLEHKIIAGKLRSDHRQREVMKNLQTLYEDVQSYSPGITRRYLHASPPKGLYIYGSVGAGKTMLMDVFYSSVKTSSKRRTHFNDFMSDVHSRLHAEKKNRPSDRSQPWDPFKPVAKALIKRAWLLCFDEFQVTDIGDAMILKSLFTELFNQGMVMVATSNRAPDDLYKDGLQRSNFIPFIHLLKDRCKIASLSGPDYRRKVNQGIGNKYFIMHNGEEKIRMDHIFQLLCDVEGKRKTSKTLKILGRSVTFRRSCGRVLDVSFYDLCEKPLGAADYIQIARNFDTIIIRNIPKMSLEKRNQARRFILLIDTLYDQKVRIVVSAAASPQNLFNRRPGATDWEHRSLMDDLQIDSKSANAKASIFSGSEELFAFDRTVSRLIEMSSESYWKRHEKHP